MYVIILSKTSLCVKLKKVFNCKQNNELVNYPPTNVDAVNPLRPVAMPSDHHRKNYRGMTIACSDSDRVEEECGTVNTYGSYSRTVTRVISFEDEVTENSPLIPASLKI